MTATTPPTAVPDASDPRATGPGPTAAGPMTLEAVRRPAFWAIVANVGIVLTGGIVRVTASGLGCADWPTCDGTSIVPSGDEAGWHAFIEFGNRLLTFVVLATAVWVVLAARKHAAARPDVLRLAWLQPIGVLGQAVLGGITVLTDLNPLVVAAHFLLSMAIIAAAVVLHDRVTHDATDPDRATPTQTLVRPGWLRGLAIGMGAVGATVLVLGTLVTAAGPHAGDPGTKRLGLDIRSMAFAHADAVWLLVGLTVAVLAVSAALGLDRVRRAATVLLVLELVQGGIGYGQYALGIPAELVSLHILGAALVWVGVVRTSLAIRTAAPT